MVSAYFLPTKGRAIVAPDQLQALPLKVCGRIAAEQFTVVATVRESHSEPAHTRQDHTARKQGQDFIVTIRSLGGNIALCVQTNTPQSGRAADEHSQFPATLADSGNQEQESPMYGQWHEENERNTGQHCHAAEQQHALP